MGDGVWDNITVDALNIKPVKDNPKHEKRL
jgi:hypothetical protein